MTTLTAPSPMRVARNRAARLAAPATPRLAYSTTTGVRPAAPSERDRRNAQAALEAIWAIVAPFGDEGFPCCAECDLGADTVERLYALHLVVGEYERDCRDAGVPSALTGYRNA